MQKPMISIIASAIRPENWPGLYENIGENDIEYELVFVGPNEPTFSLPDNFKYIKSNVKPAQCVEIAARHASGTHLLWTADDHLFTDTRSLDKLWELYSSFDHDNIIVSTALDAPEGWNRFGQYGGESPKLALCGLMSMRLWRDIGGVDRRFIAVNWDHDVCMRVIEQGGEIVLSDVFMDVDIVLPDRPDSRGTLLYDEVRSYDSALLKSLWSSENNKDFSRTSPLEPLSNEKILERSQQPQGRWRHRSSLINNLTTAVTGYRLRQWRSATAGRAYRFALRNTPGPVSRLLRRLWADRKR